MKLQSLLNNPCLHLPPLLRISRWWRDYTDDSPQSVVAHAKWRRKRGHTRPSMVWRNLDPVSALITACNMIAGRYLEDLRHAELVAAEQAARPKTWRADRRRDEFPTVTFEVVVAEDLAKVVPGEIWHLKIFHVKSVRGNGFRANVSAAGSMRGSGTFLGEGPEAYGRAFAEGIKTLDDAIAESQRRMAVQDQVRLLIHRGKRREAFGLLTVAGM